MAQSFIYYVCPSCESPDIVDGKDYYRCQEPGCEKIFEFPEEIKVQIECPICGEMDEIDYTGFTLAGHEYTCKCGQRWIA